MRKKFLSSFLSVLLLALLMPSPNNIVWAETSGNCGPDRVTWVLDDEGKLTITGTGNMNNYSIYSRAPWYESKDDITSVEIKDGVTSIGVSAFYNCFNLATVSFDSPSKVESIGDQAFSNCCSLTSITIPSSMTSIGISSFSNCSNLATVNFDSPSKVESIGDNAFNSTNLTSITIPSSVTSIGNYLFDRCSKLTTINVDSGNTTYEDIDGVLINKTDNTLILYPQDKTDTSYAIPSTVTSIGDWAFNECTNLTSITIPSSVTYIGNSAFSDCSNLATLSFEFPSKVEGIGDSAFSGCSGLTSITIPSSATSIRYYAFDGCSKLTAINVDSENTTYKSIDGCLFSADGTELLAIPGGKEGIYIVPDSVKNAEVFMNIHDSKLTAVFYTESNNVMNHGGGETAMIKYEVIETDTSTGAKKVKLTEIDDMRGTINNTIACDYMGEGYYIVSLGENITNKSLEHTYGDFSVYSEDPSKHIHTCTKCGSSEILDHDLTFYSEGIFCPDCGLSTRFVTKNITINRTTQDLAFCPEL